MHDSYKEYREPPAAPMPQRFRYRRLFKELTIGMEFIRLGRSMPRLMFQPRGERQRVVLIPGWGAPQASMEPLRRYLLFLGYDAVHWGLGTNHGQPHADSMQLLQQLEAYHSATQRRSTLIGWSLGGVIARECARRAPEMISQVITYGTPVIGGPSYTVAAKNWGKEECENIALQLRILDTVAPISTPMGIVFSRRDHVVSWPACIDRVSHNVIHYEVNATHMGLGISPAVWHIVAKRLGLSQKN